MCPLHTALCIETLFVLQGGEEALCAVVRLYRGEVLSIVPKIQDLIESGLTADHSSPTETQAILDSLQCLRVAGPVMDHALDAKLGVWLTQLHNGLAHARSIVRTQAAKCAAALVGSRPEILMNELVR